ncbi:hypothetical protein CWI36_0257p0010 [Hamiltosporidium magnivora]|uniref:Uncharacterized protein n=1 Tax=Hamiltosporidium magnivora TaxID=148818 RepID=A0A4Q9LIE3_9MICR|nr:hypothetical protein CWI36_0257p0010 [Hamiltosporidium magnivora]
MYPLVVFGIASLLYSNKKIYLDLRKCFKHWIPGIFILTYITATLFLRTNSCASVMDPSSLQFAFLNDFWKNKFFERKKLSGVKYWLSCQDGKKSKICLGTHHFEDNLSDESFLYSENDFNCSLGISLYHHEPLDSFEIDYSAKWKVKFRVLNNFRALNLDNRPFIFENRLKVKYNEFCVFVNYLTLKDDMDSYMLSYKLFYKFLGMIEMLDPISSVFLNRLYSFLLKTGFLGADSDKIISDYKEYKTKYLDSKKHSIMYFFLVLDDSLDACLHREFSYISLFKKTNQLIDCGFRRIDHMSFVAMNISASTVEYIVKKFNREQLLIFNWILSCIEVSGFYFNKIEMTYAALIIPRVCDFGVEKLVEVERGSLHLVSPMFFELLSPTNIERISFFRFKSIMFSFDSLVSVFKKNTFKYFEISDCSFIKPQIISSLFPRKPSLEILKLQGIVLSNQDVVAILYLSIRTLVLNKCEMGTDFNRKTKYNDRVNYKILKSLRSLDISFSKLSVELLSLLLNADSIEKLNFSSFEFIPRGFFKQTLFDVKRNWVSLITNKYIPSEYFMNVARSAESVKFFVLSQVSFEGCFRFFFSLHNLFDTVQGLDISGKIISIEIMNLLGGFKQVSQLNIANSLPASLVGLDKLNLFKTVEYLNVSGNIISSDDDNFVIKFRKLTKLDLSKTNLKDDALNEILNSGICDSLIHLDLCGVELSEKNYRKLCEFKLLKHLSIDFKKSLNVSQYADILKDAIFRENLNVFCVEAIEINLIDFFKLISFPKLKKFRLACYVFDESVRFLQRNNIIYEKNLRIEIVSMEALPCYIIEVLSGAFEDYCISIVENMSVCIS